MKHIKWWREIIEIYLKYNWNMFIQPWEHLIIFSITSMQFKWFNVKWLFHLQILCHIILIIHLLIIDQTDGLLFGSSNFFCEWNKFEWKRKRIIKKDSFNNNRSKVAHLCLDDLLSIQNINSNQSVWVDEILKQKL